MHLLPFSDAYTHSITCTLRNTLTSCRVYPFVTPKTTVLVKGIAAYSVEELKTYLGTVTTIDLTAKSIGDEGTKALANNLASNNTITTLNISWNNIDAKGARALADALASNTTITCIDLGWNYIGDEGVKALADTLASNTNITTIHLCDNGIGAEGAKALANALARNTTIATIGLGSNSIGAEGAKELAGALASNTTITTIYLAWNNIGTEGAKALANTLAINTSITFIDLCSNSIGAEGAKALINALASNTTIAIINLHENNIGAEGQRALKKEGFSPINLDTILYGGNGSESGSADSDLYYNMKTWGRKRSSTSDRLPLFTAAARSLAWVDVRQIFAVNMPAIHDIDGLTGLTVFMLAAVGPNSSIESVYNLLKEYPSSIGLVNDRHHNTATCTATKKVQDNLVNKKRQKRR